MAPFTQGKHRSFQGQMYLEKAESPSKWTELLRADGLDRKELWVGHTRRVVATPRGM